MNYDDNYSLLDCNENTLKILDYLRLSQEKKYHLEIIHNKGNSIFFLYFLINLFYFSVDNDIYGKKNIYDIFIQRIINHK